MAYIGATPTVGNFQVCDAISVVNGQAAYTLQVGGVNVTPESANHMLVSLNGILQKPGSSFTISGSTMTFASNLATGDVIDFVQILGNVLDIGQPSDDTVKTASIQANAVTAAKLNNDIISGTTALTSAPDDTDEFLVSDAGTLKRIDYSLIKGGGAFEHLLTTTASSSSTIAFSSTYLTTTYLDYKVVFSGLKCSSDSTYFQVKMSTDNGSSYTDFNYRVVRVARRDNGSDANSQQQDNAAASLMGSKTTGNASDEKNFSGFFDIYDPLKQSGTTDCFTIGQAHTVHMTSNGEIATNEVGVAAKTTTAINNIQFSFTSGNIVSGKISLYGRKVS